MIIELSKDKSFYGLLSKAELDNETTELVKQQASPIEIKMSLLKNLDSSNMVKYRKYIKKADEEELERDRLLSEEEDYTAQGDIVDEQLSIEGKEQDSRRGSDLLEKEKETKAYNFLISLQKQLPSFKQIAEDVKVIRSDMGKSSLEARNAMKPYLKVGKSRKKSNQLVNLFKVLEKQPNYFMDRFGEMLVEGVLSGKSFSTDKQTKEVTYDESKADIDVKLLAAEYNKLAQTNIDVLDKDNMKTMSTIPFKEVIELLHIQKHKRLPTASVDKRKRGDELRRIQRRLKEGVDEGGDRQINKEYRKAKKLVLRHRKKVTAIKGKLTAVESTIEDLEELLNNADSLVSRKFQQLNSALKVMMTSGGLGKISPEEVRAKTAEIRDLQNNKERYINEAKAEVEKEIGDEKIKLNKYKADLEAAAKTEQFSKEFMKKVDAFSAANPIPEIKELIIQGLNAMSHINRIMTKIEREASKAEEDISEGSIAYASNNPDVKWESVGGDMDFVGLPTIANDALRTIDGLIENLQEKQEQLTKVNEALDTKIQGVRNSGQEEQE